MQRATLVFPREILLDLIVTLDKLGYVTFLHTKEDQILNFKREVASDYHKIGMLTDNIEGLLERNGIDPQKIDEKYQEVLENVDVRLYSIVELYSEYEELEKFFGLGEQIENLRRELKGLRLIRKIAEKHPEALTIYRSETSRLLKIPKQNMETFEETLRNLDVPYIVLREKKFGMVLVDIQDSDTEESLSKFFEDCEVQEIEFPRGEKIATFNELKELESTLEKTIKRLEEQLGKNRGQKIIELIKLYRKASITNRIFAIQNLAYIGEYTAIIYCLIPNEKKDEFQRAISEKYSDTVMLAIEKAPEDIRVATSIKP